MKPQRPYTLNPPLSDTERSLMLLSAGIVIGMMLGAALVVAALSARGMLA